MQRKHLLLVGGDDNTLLQLKDIPIDITYVADKAVKDSSILFSVIEYHDPIDTGSLVELIKERHKQRPFDAVISFKEEWLETASMFKEMLGIKGNPLRPVSLSRNKVLFRRALADTKLGNILFKVVDTPEELNAFQKATGGAVILKPIKGCGSFGVKLLRSDDLSNVANQDKLFEDISFAWMRTSGSQYIAESYAPGKEYSIEALSNAGSHQILAVTERRVIANDKFVGKGHIIPANLDNRTLTLINETINLLLNSIGQYQGPSHTELKVSGEDIAVIETQTRSGGANIWNLLEMTKGINIRTKAVCDLLDLEYTPVKPICNTAGVAYLHSPEGILDKIIDQENVLEQSYIHDYKFNCKTGDYLRPIEESLDRRGYVVVKGDTYEFVRNTVELLDTNFKFILKDHHA